MQFSLKRLAMAVAVPLIGAGALLAMTAPSSAAGPSATASQTTGLTGGTKVNVSGSGFSPGASLAIVVCNPRAANPPAPFKAQDECDITHLAFATAGSNGSFPATSFTVPQTGSSVPFAPADHSATCPPTPNTTFCAITVANISNQNEHAVIAIVYAGQPAPTTTTTTPGQTTTTVAGQTTTTAAPTATTAAPTTAVSVQATTATSTSGSSTLPVTGSTRRLLGLAVLGAGFVVLGFALTAGGRRARHRRHRA
jgi:hypothetical protein